MEFALSEEQEILIDSVSKMLDSVCSIDDLRAQASGENKFREKVNKEFIEMGPNDHVYIPVTDFNRMENIGDVMVEFVETQIGDYLGEDDIVRLEDDYERVK